MDIKNPLGLPDLASVHGADVDKLILYVHYLMFALFVGWSVYFVYSLWRFRASRNAKASYAGVTSHVSNYVEVAIVAVEVVLLIGFAVPLWARVADDFPAEDKSYVVRITGQQFAWMARYPGADRKFGKQDIELVTSENPLGLAQKNDKTKAADVDGKDDALVPPQGQLALPVNTNIIAHITSMDVIHSFKVTPLRVTQDAIPGLSIPIHFFPTKTNVYQITCAQLCGNGHSNMKGTIRVMEQAEFDAWLKAKAGVSTSYE